MIKYTQSTTYFVTSHQIFPACPSTANETCIWYQNHGKDDQGWTQIAALASPDGSPVSDREPLLLASSSLHAQQEKIFGP